jgi:hypothetical protein
VSPPGDEYSWDTSDDDEEEFSGEEPAFDSHYDGAEGGDPAGGRSLGSNYNGAGGRAALPSSHNPSKTGKAAFSTMRQGGRHDDAGFSTSDGSSGSESDSDWGEFDSQDEPEPERAFDDVMQPWGDHPGFRAGLDEGHGRRERPTHNPQKMGRATYATKARPGGVRRSMCWPACW